MVNQSNIFKKIGYILNELQDQYEFLSENPDQLSELELELFLANANFLSDHVQIVKKLNGKQILKELPQATEQEVVAASTAEVEKEPIHAPEVAPKLIEEEAGERDNHISFKEDAFKFDDTPATFEFILSGNTPKETPVLEEVIADNHHEEMVDYFEDTDPEIANNESIETEMGEPEDTETVNLTESIKEDVEDEVGPEPFLVEAQSAPEPSVNVVPELIERKNTDPVVATTKPTINDLLASQKAPNFNEDNSRPVITDLKKAVNLNEKLLYIKDLFNGYNLAYSEAIDILNKLPDFKTADAFLKNNYSVKNNWDSKPGTVEKFYDLLRQRFPGD
ncbi:hypothetical protein ACXZ1K_07250 [Pedobacter sp. PWIIR3]